MSYDPDPRRRRKHGPRKGVEPAGLKRYRLALKRTHDPRPRRAKRTYTGPRGGQAWIGPKKRRYDPPRRQGGGFAGYRSRHPRASGIFGKAAQQIDRFAVAIGMALGFGVPAYQSIQGNMWTKGVNWWKWFSEGIPNSTKDLFAMRPEQNIKGIGMLQYKFLNPQSHWMAPFWISLGARILSGMHFFGFMPGKYNTIIKKVSTGALIGTTLGALFCPGSAPYTGNSGSSNTTTQTELAHYA